MINNNNNDNNNNNNNNNSSNDNSNDNYIHLYGANSTIQFSNAPKCQLIQACYFRAKSSSAIRSTDT